VNQKATLENAGKGIGLGDAGAVGMDDAGGLGAAVAVFMSGDRSDQVGVAITRRVPSIS
jgi:hypothetical protein